MRGSARVGGCSCRSAGGCCSLRRPSRGTSFADADPSRAPRAIGAQWLPLRRAPRRARQESRAALSDVARARADSPPRRARVAGGALAVVRAHDGLFPSSRAGVGQSVRRGAGVDAGCPGALSRLASMRAAPSPGGWVCALSAESRSAGSSVPGIARAGSDLASGARAGARGCAPGRAVRLWKRHAAARCAPGRSCLRALLELRNRARGLKLLPPAAVGSE
jgi:hypothetical protein